MGLVVVVGGEVVVGGIVGVLLGCRSWVYLRCR